MDVKGWRIAKTMKQEKKKILYDCMKVYFAAVMFYAFKECAVQISTILAGELLGSASDTILQKNIHLGMEYFKELVLCVLILIVLPSCLSVVGEMLMTKASLWHGRVVLDRFFNKSYDSVCKIEKSEAQYRLEDDQIELGITWTNLLTNGIALPVILSFFLYRSIRILGWYTLIVIAVSMIKLIVPLVLKKRLAVYDMENREFQSAVRNRELDIAGNPYQIGMLGIQSYIIGSLKSVYEKYYRNSFVKNIKTETWMEYLLNGMDFFCQFLLLFTGAVAVAKGALTPGSVITMLTYFGVFNIVIGYFDYMIKNIPILSNMVDRMLIFYEDEETGKGAPLGPVSEIEFRNVSFSYGEKEVLENLNLKIGRKEKVALTGSNGSGKSTIIKLMIGLHLSYKGEIRINGKELRDISQEDLNRQIAYVEQKPFLFGGSVRENISPGDRNTSTEQVDEVAGKLNITGLLEKDAGSLSGGELQKAAVARALMKKASVLILDEPTNNLDTESVEWLEEFIRNYEGMLIFVSHEENLIGLSGKAVS